LQPTIPITRPGALPSLIYTISGVPAVNQYYW